MKTRIRPLEREDLDAVAALYGSVAHPAAAVLAGKALLTRLEGEWWLMPQRLGAPVRQPARAAAVEPPQST